MTIKTSPEEIWKEYQAGLAYNQSDEIDLVNTVQQNEDFFNGKQWEGVNAPNLDKPVFNFLRRVVTFFISTVVSDDIAVSLSEFVSGRTDTQVLDMVGRQLGEVMELSGFKSKSRDAMRNSAVDGDGCLHYYFDPGEVWEDDAPQAEAGADDGPDAAAVQVEPMPGTEGEAMADAEEAETPGTIQAELLDNTDVIFGNPQLWDVQKQPWIIVKYRLFVEEAQDRAKQNGQSGDGIAEDDDDSGINTKLEEHKVTVLRKYFKRKGRLWYIETTKNNIVTPETEAGYRLYPLIWWSWERVKNQYHGRAAITGMIPNQIFVNKLFAMSMEHVKRMAFPKVVYNRHAIPGGWSNQVGAAIGVAGDPNQAVATNFSQADMSNQVLVLIDKVIQHTRDTMGASDAALGNIKPDNTSAIIATQKATAMPLELQKMDFYQMVEDSVRIWLEMMGENYGLRKVEMSPGDLQSLDGVPGVQADLTARQAMEQMAQAPPGPDGMPVAPMAAEEQASHIVLFDFSVLKDLNLRLNVDIGASTYWSELMQVQTLDNLMNQGIITDPEIYLEMVPAAYIKNKHILLDKIKKQKAAAALAAQQAQQPADAGLGEALSMPQELGGLPQALLPPAMPGADAMMVG